ncbi:protein PFC0760c isoform X5 [Hydra vulgaris]|uniref:protein PFC0760c isoform X5 n=1 Tax=Hydra vulgaris TaxID=6087 RepID=UPI001F5F73B0|nr:protein PFC0760c isoform X5 [Hydra vulgaris]
MATNAEHKTIAINVYKKTVKVKSKKDNDEYPRAELKDGKYQLPWKTDAEPPDGWANFKSFFFPDSSGVPNDEKLNEEPLMQLTKADPQQIENPPENGIRVTWLGHASVLFQLDSANLLVNPNFSARGIKYYHPGDNKRYRQPVYSVEQLPRIDCVFITNTHFDYLDLSSVRQLNNRFGKMLLWYVPMGVCDWMKKAGCVNVVEMDWWKKDQIEFIDSAIVDKDDETKTTVFTIACTPSQSYHNRAFDDDNAVLWCSWVICSSRYKIFVSGSTGYAKVFQSIGKKYGPFHIAALPIGGYDPKSRNGYGNLTPEQAVQVHKDILAMHTLALSWGTFTLSSEHYLEPPHRLNDELKKSGLSNTQFFVLKHGESRLIIINDLLKEDANGYIKKKTTETESQANNIIKETQTEEQNNSKTEKSLLLENHLKKNSFESPLVKNKEEHLINVEFGTNDVLSQNDATKNRVKIIEGELNDELLKNVVKETQQKDHGCDCCNQHTKELLTEVPVAIACPSEVFSESSVQENETKSETQQYVTSDKIIKETVQVEYQVDHHLDDHSHHAKMKHPLNKGNISIACPSDLFLEYEIIDNKKEEKIETGENQTLGNNVVVEKQKEEHYNDQNHNYPLTEDPSTVTCNSEPFAKTNIKENKTEKVIETKPHQASLNSVVNETQKEEHLYEQNHGIKIKHLSAGGPVTCTSEVLSEIGIKKDKTEEIEINQHQVSVNNIVNETIEKITDNDHKQNMDIDHFIAEKTMRITYTDMFSEYDIIEDKTEESIETNQNEIQQKQHNENKHITLAENLIAVTYRSEVFLESSMKEDKTEDKIESVKNQSLVDIKEIQQEEEHDEHKHDTEIKNALKEELLVVASTSEVFSENKIDSETEDNIESEKDDSSVDNSVKETQQEKGHDEHKHTEVVNILKEEPVVVVSTSEVFTESYIDNKTEYNIESEKDDSSVDNSVKETQQEEGHNERKHTEVVNILKEEPVVVASTSEVFTECYIDSKTEDNIESEKDDLFVNISVKETQQEKGHDEHKHTDIVNNLKEEPVVVASTSEVFTESYIDNKTEYNIESEKGDSSVDNSVKETQQEEGHDEHKHVEIVNILKEEPVVVASTSEVFSENKINDETEYNIESEKGDSSVDNSVKITLQEEGHDERKHTEIVNILKEEPVVVASTSEVFSESYINSITEYNIESEKDDSSVNNSVKETRQEEGHDEHKNGREIEYSLKEEPMVVVSTSEMFLESNIDNKAQDNIKSEKDQLSVDNNVKETQQKERHEHKYDTETKNILKEELVVVTSTSEVFSESNIEVKIEDNIESGKDQSSVGINIKETQQKEKHNELKHDTEIEEPVVVASSTEVFSESNIDDKTESEKDQLTVDNNVKETQQEERHEHKHDTEIKNTLREEPVVVTSTSEVFSESNIEVKIEDNIESEKDQSSVDINVKEIKQEEQHDELKYNTEINRTLKEEPVVIARAKEMFSESKIEDKTKDIIESEKNQSSVDNHVKERQYKEQHAEYKQNTEIENTLRKDAVVFASSSEVFPENNIADKTGSEKDQSLIDINVKESQQEEGHDELKYDTEIKNTLKEEPVVVICASEVFSESNIEDKTEDNIKSGKDQSAVDNNVKETQQEEHHDEHKHVTEIEKTLKEEPVVVASTYEVFLDSNNEDKTESGNDQSSVDNNVKKTQQEEEHDEHKHVTEIQQEEQHDEHHKEQHEKHTHGTEIENKLKEKSLVVASAVEVFSENNIRDKTEDIIEFEKDLSSVDINVKETQPEEQYDEHKHDTEIKNTLKEEPVVVASTSQEDITESEKNQSDGIIIKKTQQEEHDELEHDTEIDNTSKDEHVVVASTNEESAKDQLSININVKETQKEERHDELKPDRKIENTLKEEPVVVASTSEVFSGSNIDKKTEFEKDQLSIDNNVKEIQQEEHHDEHKHDTEIENTLKEEPLVVASSTEVFSESNIDDKTESEKDQLSVDNNVKEIQQEEHHDEHKHNTEIENTLKEEPLVVASLTEVFSESNIDDKTESEKDQLSVDNNVKEIQQEEHHDEHKHNTEIENTLKEEPLVVASSTEVFLESNIDDKTESEKDQLSVDNNVKEIQQEEHHDEHKHNTEIENTLKEEPLVVASLTEVFSESNIDDKTESEKDHISVDNNVKEIQQEEHHDEHKHNTEIENTLKEEPLVVASSTEVFSESNIDDKTESEKDQLSVDNNVKEIQQEEHHDEHKHDTEIENTLKEEPLVVASSTEVFSESNIDDKTESEKDQLSVDNNVKEIQQEEHHDEHKHDTEIENTLKEESLVVASSTEVFLESNIDDKTESEKDQLSVDNNVKEIQQEEHHDEHKHNTEIENTLKEEPLVVASSTEVFLESNIDDKTESEKGQLSVNNNVKEIQQEELHDEYKHDTETENTFKEETVVVVSTSEVFSEINIGDKTESERDQLSVDNNVKEIQQEEQHEHKHDTEIKNTLKEVLVVVARTSEVFSESNIEVKIEDNIESGKDQSSVNNSVKETQQEERHNELKNDTEIKNALKEEPVVVASTSYVFSESYIGDKTESENGQSSVDNNVEEIQQEERHDEHKHNTEIENTLKEETVVVASTSEVFSESNIKDKVEDNIESKKNQALVDNNDKETQLEERCDEHKHNKEIENRWKEDPIVVNIASDFVTENKDINKTEDNIESAKGQSSVDKIVTETQQKEPRDEHKHETETEHLLTEEPEKPIAPINHQSSVDCINNENQEEVDCNEHKQDTKAENASSEPVLVVCVSEVRKHSENNKENKIEDSVELGKDQSSLNNIVKEVQQEKCYDEFKDETETEHSLNKEPNEKMEFKQHKASVDNIVYETKEHEHFDEHKNDIKIEHASIKDPVSASYNSEEVIVTKNLHQQSVNGFVEQNQHTEHRYDDRSNDVHHVCNPLLMNDSKTYCDESITCTTEFCKNDEKEDKRGKKIETELHHESVDTLVEATLREISP